MIDSRVPEGSQRANPPWTLASARRNQHNPQIHSKSTDTARKQINNAARGVIGKQKNKNPKENQPTGAQRSMTPNAYTC